MSHTKITRVLPLDTLSELQRVTFTGKSVDPLSRPTEPEPKLAAAITRLLRARPTLEVRYDDGLATVVFARRRCSMADEE